MSIEDVVGPILAAVFLLGMLLEAIWPREEQPRLRLWRLVGVAFFVLNGFINVVFPLLLPVEWVATHSLIPGYKLGVAGGFAFGFLVWTFVYYWYHRSEHRFDVMWRGLHQLRSPRQMVIGGRGDYSTDLPRRWVFSRSWRLFWM